MSNLSVLLLFFALCFSAFVFASGPHAHQTHSMMREVSNLDGQFVRKKDVLISYPQTKKECTEAGGRWEYQHDEQRSYACLVESENSVTVTPTEVANQYEISISTVGLNARLCDYTNTEAQRLENPTRLVARTSTQMFDEETERLVPTECEVTVLYHNHDFVSVTVNDELKCVDLCANGTSLQVDSAERQ